MVSSQSLISLSLVQIFPLSCYYFSVLEVVIAFIIRSLHEWSLALQEIAQKWNCDIGEITFD